MTAQELKAAILDLAIRGKLVPQDPNDESADRLLERINEVWSCVPRDRKSATRGRLGRATLPPIVNDEKPFDLPKGWMWCRLGEISNSIADGDHQPPPQVDEGIPFLVISNVSSGKLSLEKVRHVDRVYFKSLSETRRASKGDILFTVTGSYGIPIVVEKEFEFCFQRHIALIKIAAGELKYLYYVLLTALVKHQCDEIATGIAQKTVPISGLRNILVPLPPLAEQKRIVARIEELMPWVELYAAAEEKRGKLDAALPGQLKQSILKAAFAGALVADSVGVEKTLDAVCAGVFTGNSLSDLEKRKFTRPDGLPFIGTKDVGFDQVITYDNGIRIPKTEDGYRIAPKGATLLCVEGGSSGRKIGLLMEDVRFGNKLCAFVPGDDLDARYLFLLLQSPQFLEQFAGLQNGPRKGAGVSQVKGLLIPMLPLAKQKELVRRIDDFLLLIQKM